MCQTKLELFLPNITHGLTFASVMLYEIRNYNIACNMDTTPNQPNRNSNTSNQEQYDQCGNSTE